MPHTTTRLLSVVFILWVPWQLMMVQVADDHVLLAWTQRPQAHADYVPPDYRVIEFPETSVGLVYLASKNERTGVWEHKRDGYDLWNADSMGDCVLANAKGRVAIPN